MAIKNVPYKHSGEKHWNSTLTNDEVRKIKIRIKEGESNKAIAKDHDVTKDVIKSIRTGRC